MFKKFSPDQFKFGLLIVLLLYLVNGQKGTTAANRDRPADSSNNGAIALAAPPATASQASAGIAPTASSSCPSGQRRVQVEADAVLNLRSSPNGPILTTLLPGTAVSAQRSQGQWSEVITPSGQVGWAFNQYLGCS
jgi:hypothetical protein